MVDAPSAGFKVCGLTAPGDVDAAVRAGASHVGLVFFERSPRHLSLEAAAALAERVPPGVVRVALTVDMDDDALDALLAAVPVDMLQLHGEEAPARAAALRGRLPVMKAVGVRDAADLDAAAAYEGAVDMLLLDAKPPRDALPGGNGLAFDWTLLAGRRWPVPWMLAGGLRPETVAEAVRSTGAPYVDVSSGVEGAPGVKDPARIAAFGAALSPRPSPIADAAAGTAPPA